MQGPLYEDPAFRPVALALCFCSVSVYISFYFVLCGLQKQYKWKRKQTSITECELNGFLQVAGHEVNHYFESGRQHNSRLCYHAKN